MSYKLQTTSYEWAISHQYIETTAGGKFSLAGCA
jgi:hypothetical protein